MHTYVHIYLSDDSYNYGYAFFFTYKFDHFHAQILFSIKM